MQSPCLGDYRTAAPASSTRAVGPVAVRDANEAMSCATKVTWTVWLPTWCRRCAHLPIVDVQRVVTVMLVLLLFHGGMHIGWRRFRQAAGPVLWIGVVGGLLLPLRLTGGERLFVMWSGLKGAVLILLGTYLLSAAVADADRLYQVVVVVVAFSVIVQGGLVPAAARRTGVPMRLVEPEPWSLNVRLRDEPTGLHEAVVAPGSPADGTAVKDLDLGEDMWISLVNRAGELVPVNGATVLRAGDEVLLMVDPNTTHRYDLFTSPKPNTHLDNDPADP